MSIDVPVAGSPILDTWGAAVAADLNARYIDVLAAAVETNASTATGAVLFTIPVVSGKVYQATLVAAYSVSATNQGLQLEGVFANGASGTIRGYWRMTGNASATGYSEGRFLASTWDGRTTTDAANAFRGLWIDWTMEVTGTGDLQLLIARGGTSGSPGVKVNAGAGLHMLVG